MPGECHADAPAAVPLQLVLNAPSASVNGRSCPAPPACTDNELLRCPVCTKKALIVCGGCWKAGFCCRAHHLSHWPVHRDNCRPCKVSSNAELGRFMMATRDLNPGDLILRDAPLMLGPKMITEPVCLGCYRPVAGDYFCTDCGFPVCDADCQASEQHQPECQAVVASASPVHVTVFGEINSMYECITPLRMLTMRESEPELWQKLISLESHSEKRDGTEVAAITQQTVVEILHDRLQLRQYEDDLIQQVLGIIDTNAFEIRLPDSSILGVYPNASLLEHSCIANTHRTFDADLNLVVRAAVKIKRGEHFTSCYTDALSTTATRQEHLLTSKFFTCICRRCCDPTELGTFLSALRCPSCEDIVCDIPLPVVVELPQREAPRPIRRIGAGRGSLNSEAAPPSASAIPPGPWIVPEDPLSPSAPWVCEACSAPATVDYATKITAVVTEESDELEAATHSIATCEAFLQKWAHLLHPNHAVCINLKYALLHLYGSEEGYELEELSVIDLMRKEELCRELMAVADILIPGISRLRGSVLYELFQTLRQKSRLLYKVGVASSEQAKLVAQEASTLLKECARVLSYEPPVQPEGQLGLEAKEELENLQKWIATEGWKQ